MKSLLQHVPEEFINPSDKFRNALDSISIHYWYMNSVAGSVLLSPDLRNLLDISGDSFEESISQMRALVHPEDIASLSKAYRHILEGFESVLEIDMRIKTYNNWSWYYVRGSVITRGEKGNPVILGGITMDISQRYSKMLDRIEEAGKFEFIFKSTNQPVFLGKTRVLGKPGRIIEANDAACQLLQCNRNDVIGLEPSKIINDQSIGSYDEISRQFLESGTFNREVEITTFKGEKRYAEIIAHPYSQKGEDLFIAVVNDKTESRKIKNELKASEHALKRSEHIYRTLIHSANDRIALFDLEGNIEIMNDSFYTNLGYSTEEFDQIGRMEQVHPEDKELINITKKELQDEGYVAYDYRVLHKTGYYLHMSAKGVQIKDADLGKVFYLFIIRDISEQVEFADELIRAKDRAEESDQLKSAFLANISHEIRTPMNSIIGFANLLSEDDITPKEKEEYIDRINKNSEQLLTLISDIIDLAKIESNQLSVSFSRVLIEHVMQEVLNFARHQLELKNRTGIELKYDPDPEHESPVLETDLMRLVQILQNLISNAVKFTNRGVIKVGYRVFHEEKIQFFVEDTGQGIKKKNFNLIFEQFRQEDETDTRKYGGAGLGLAICRHLSALLNGSIRVDSEVGKGSCFTVEFPLSSLHNIDKNETEEVTTYQVILKRKILIVDDDPDSLMLLRTILRKAGLEVKECNSGYKALEIMEVEGLPDLVLLDLQMPVLNGMQTMRIIKEKYPDLKLIAQSAHGYEGDADEFKKAGFDEYIAKPYTKDQLLNMVIRILN